MLRRYLVFILCVFTISCEILGPNETGRLEVHLQSSFDHTPVLILLDSEVVYDSLATTDYIGGIAERIPLRASYGTHTLELLIDDEHSHLQHITLGPTVLYVGVEYTQRGEIAIRLSNKGFVYF